MGMNMSSMGIGLNKGASVSQILSLATDKLYDKFVEKDVEDIDGFLRAILDTFSAINTALPGKHYDPPPLKDVTDLFNEWRQEASDDEKRKKVFTEFMKKNVNMNKVDEAMIITAIVAPPTAMVAKRTGQTLPQLRLMKSVPDVVFVPTATLAALVAVKILRYMFMGKTTSTDEQPKGGGDEEEQPKHDGGDEQEQPKHDGGNEQGQPKHDGGDEQGQPKHDDGDEQEQPKHDAGDEQEQAKHDAGDEQEQPKHDGGDEHEQPKHAPLNFYCASCDRYHTAEELLEHSKLKKRKDRTK